MSHEKRLEELLSELSRLTGKRRRFQNEVLETLGPNPTLAEQIKVAERVLAEPDLGWAGGKLEAGRAGRLRRERQDG